MVWPRDTCELQSLGERPSCGDGEQDASANMTDHLRAVATSAWFSAERRKRSLNTNDKQHGIIILII